MIGPALTLITYVWHYVVARLVYDRFLEPVIDGRRTLLLLAWAALGGSFLAWRWSARRRARRTRALASRRRT